MDMAMLLVTEQTFSMGMEVTTVLTITISVVLTGAMLIAHLHMEMDLTTIPGLIIIPIRTTALEITTVQDVVVM